MKAGWRVRHLLLLICALPMVAVGCRSAGSGGPVSETNGPWWDVNRAEYLVWDADDPSFQQEMALEGSGLVAHEGKLLACSEKYAHLLRIDPETLQAEALELGLPKFAEIEGVTVDGGEILLCDEANAAVWVGDFSDVSSNGRIDLRRLNLDGLSLSGGKLGVEGITVSPGPSREVFLMLERSGKPDQGCRATIFRLVRLGEALENHGNPLVIPMEDCNWRLTGLQFWNGHLLALKTRYPGERYEVVEVNTMSGELTTVLEMTDLLVGVRDKGWGNNVEGLTVTEDGALWMISDNAMTHKIERSKPALARDKTLLLRLPPLNLPRTH